MPERLDQTCRCIPKETFHIYLIVWKIKITMDLLSHFEYFSPELKIVQSWTPKYLYGSARKAYSKSTLELSLPRSPEAPKTSFIMTPTPTKRQHPLHQKNDRKPPPSNIPSYPIRDLVGTFAGFEGCWGAFRDEQDVQGRFKGVGIILKDVFGAFGDLCGVCGRVLWVLVTLKRGVGGVWNVVIGVLAVLGAL